MMAMSAAAMRGTVLDGKYVLTSPIGGGRFGTVYAATHIALQKAVAVKVLHAGDALAARDFARFRVEAEALGRLDHTNIVRVTDFGIDPAGAGTPYLVMELVDGRPIDERVRAAEPEDLPRIAAWLTGVAAALDHAHDAGVAHGDLSGRNVLLAVEGGSPAVKVIDFGLAGLKGQDSADLGFSLAGTPEYIAPERLRGEPPSPAADVYALAVLAYRLVSGRYPFEGRVREIVQARLTREAPPLSEAWLNFSGELDAVIRRGLAAPASERPGRASAFAGAFTSAVRNETRRRWRWREGPRRVAAAAVVALLAGAATPWMAALPAVQRIEGAAEDLRFALSTAQPADPRLQLVVLDDEALAADPTPLSHQASSVAAVLDAALAQGAAAVAFDLLLPAEWAADAAFEDLVLRHAGRIVLAVAGDGGMVVGTEAVGPLAAAALGPDAASGLFALVSHGPAPDGVVRRAHAARLDTVGALRPTMAGRLAALLDGVPLRTPAFVMDYRLEAGSLSRQGWRGFAQAVEAGARFDDQALLIGAEFAGSGDRHRVPGPGRLAAEVSGLALQGVAAHTLLQGTPLVDATSLTTRALASTAALPAGVAMLWCRRRSRAVLGAVGGLGVLLAGVHAAWLAGVLVPVAACVLAWLAAAIVTGLARPVLPGAPE